MSDISIQTGLILETIHGGSAWRVLPSTRQTSKPNYVLVESLSTRRQEYVHQQWLRTQLTRGHLKARLLM